MRSNQLHVALPDGRVLKSVANLLERGGIGLHFGHDELMLLPRVSGIERVIFYVLRPRDAAELLRQEKLDAAFIGSDLLVEAGAVNDVTCLIDTQLHPVRLCFAAPHSSADAVQQAVTNKRAMTVATKYPVRVREWAESLRYSALTVFPVGGKVEAFAGRFTDAIVDIVDSGRTLAANGLKELETIGSSTTQFVCRNGIVPGSDKAALVERIRYSLEAVLRAQGRALLRINVDEAHRHDVEQILRPYALESVNRLEGTNGTSTLQIACGRDKLNALITAARAAGGSGEAVEPVEWLGRGH